MNGRARHGWGWSLLLSVGLAACGGDNSGAGEAPAAPQAVVDEASGKCSALPELTGDPLALTQCVVAELIASCDDPGAGHCDDASGLLTPLTDALTQFCIADPVLSEIVPATIHCVRSGMAWGCPGLSFLLQVELPNCLVDQFGFICDVSGADRLQVCQRRDLVGSLSEQDRLALLAPLSASFTSVCPEGSDQECVRQGLVGLCLASPEALPFCSYGELNLPATLSDELAARLCGIGGLAELLRPACTD